MPYWYYDKKELRFTPSIGDGIDYETESRYRKEGARFIMELGGKLELGCNTMATGVVYFHRFYMFHSFRSFPRYVMACCCLFLAGKVEETPKKCKDIIRIAKQSLSEAKFGTFGEDPREEVMTLERILLQTIKFDLQVDHPYTFVVKYAKCLKGDKAKLQKMVQMAWTFVNDSLCTTLCLQWEPEIIAVALMYLAGKLSKFEVVDWSGRTTKHLRWWDMFVQDITMDLLEDICHQVLDLYSQPSTETAPDSPPLPSASAPALKSTPPSAIPVKISAMPTIQTKNGSDLPEEPKPTVSNLKPIPEMAPPPVVMPSASSATVAAVPYPYQTFTAYPPPFPTTLQPAPAHMPAPLPPGPPHLAAPPPTPPVYAYVAPPPPPHYPPGVPTPAAYYPPAGAMTQQPPPPPPPSHRGYYPPPN